MSDTGGAAGRDGAAPGPSRGPSPAGGDGRPDGPGEDGRGITVLLVDDHDVVREGLKALLGAEADLRVVAEAGTAVDAVDAARASRPDVVVMDVRLPDRSGIEACRAIRAELPDTAVLMLTSFSDEQALVDAVLAGSAGYVLKEVRGRDLVADIRRVARGETLVDQRVRSRALERARSAHDVSDPRLARLTPTELRILEMIADGLTNRGIGERLHLAEKTVKNYVSSVFTKLGVHRRAEAATYLVEHRDRDDAYRDDA